MLNMLLPSSRTRALLDYLKLSRIIVLYGRGANLPRDLGVVEYPPPHKRTGGLGFLPKNIKKIEHTSKKCVLRIQHWLKGGFKCLTNMLSSPPQVIYWQVIYCPRTPPNLYTSWCKRFTRHVRLLSAMLSPQNSSAVSRSGFWIGPFITGWVFWRVIMSADTVFIF